MSEESTINDAEDCGRRHEDEGENSADPAADFQGGRVIKSFDTAWYCGSVTGFSDDRYQITYDDGETERTTAPAI